MPFGDILAQSKPVPLKSAEGRVVVVGGNWFQNMVLRVVGVPHIGLRLRAQAVLPLLTREPGKKILDAGCGAGLYSLTLARRGYEVTGVDTDREKLDVLETLSGSLGKRLTIRQATLCKLPFPDASFDKVLCTEVLEHIEEDHKALSELSRVLKPGGILVLTVPDEHSALGAYDDHLDHVRPGYTLEGLRLLLSRHHFSLESWKTYLHSRLGEWGWKMNYRLFGSRVLTVASFYPLFWGAVLQDRLLPAKRPGLGYVVVARRKGDL